MSALASTPSVTIFRKEVSGGSYEQYDVDDACMKASLISYDMIPKTESRKAQAIFHLRLPVTVQFRNENGTPKDCNEDPDVAVVACAAESILKRLQQTGCTKKKTVLFQAIRGGTLLPCMGIYLKQDEHGKNYPTTRHEDDPISHSCATLSNKRLHLFFNDMPTETIEKIGRVLEALLPPPPPPEILMSRA
jgi:hypothetical protein